MLPEDHSEAAARGLYEDFVRQYRDAIQFLRRLPLRDGQLASEHGANLPLDGAGSLTTTSAILSTLYKSLTEFLLQEEALGEEPMEDDDD